MGQKWEPTKQADSTRHNPKLIFVTTSFCLPLLLREKNSTLEIPYTFGVSRTIKIKRRYNTFMSLHTQIRDEVKTAMLAKDTVRLNTLRGLLAAFTNEAVAKKKKPSDELTDEEALDVIKRAVKQRKDSIEQFRKGNREDLAVSEEAELAILSTYLPVQVSKEEILKVAEAKKIEVGVTDKSGMGKLMGAVMKELKGNADGNDVKAVIESIL